MLFLMLNVNDQHNFRNVDNFIQFIVGKCIEGH